MNEQKPANPTRTSPTSAGWPAGARASIAASASFRCAIRSRPSLFTGHPPHTTRVLGNRASVLPVLPADNERAAPSTVTLHPGGGNVLPADNERAAPSDKILVLTAKTRAAWFTSALCSS